ncbi:hypothetical protein J3F83DRAFT_733317 [Trichoderma novae-zelandiae]
MCDGECSHAHCGPVAGRGWEKRKASSGRATRRKSFLSTSRLCPMGSQAAEVAFSPALPTKHINHRTWPIPAPGGKNSSAERRVNGSRLPGCASERPFMQGTARWPVRCRPPDPPSGLCCVAASNHNRCLDASSRSRATSRSMVCAMADRLQCPPTWRRPGGTVRDFPGLQMLKTKGKRAPRALSDLLFLPSPLTTLFQPSCLDDTTTQLTLSSITSPVLTCPLLSFYNPSHKTESQIHDSKS